MNSEGLDRETSFDMKMAANDKNIQSQAHLNLKLTDEIQWLTKSDVDFYK